MRGVFRLRVPRMDLLMKVAMLLCSQVCYTAKSKSNRKSTVTYTARCEADDRAYVFGA